MPLRCIGVQPRTVPPDGEGGCERIRPVIRSCVPDQLNVLRCCPQTRRGIVVRFPQTVCRVPFSFADRLRTDMQDNQSVAVADPTERVVKAIVYIHDCEPGGGANVRCGCFLDWTACRLASLSSIVLQGAVVGTHRLPYGIAEVYGKQFYNGNEVRPSTPLV